MIKITLIIVGKTRSGPLRDMEEEYIKRLAAFADLNIMTVRESGISDSSDETKRKRAAEKEEKEIMAAIPGGTYCVALDERGKTMTSRELASLIQKNRDFESGNMTFIIGGPFGLGKNVKARANLVLSLSSFTFTHEMARVILLEQIYRAFTIVAGKTYHY